MTSAFTETQSISQYTLLACTHRLQTGDICDKLQPHITVRFESPLSVLPNIQENHTVKRLNAKKSVHIVHSAVRACL